MGGTPATYSVEWAGEGNLLGFCHYIDIAFVLGKENAWKAALMLAGKATEEGITELGSGLEELWANFANKKALKLGVYIELGGNFALSRDIFVD